METTIKHGITSGKGLWVFLFYLHILFLHSGWFVGLGRLCVCLCALVDLLLVMALVRLIALYSSVVFL